MKKITIGRGRECDIRLSDDTDKVSRKHAVITVSPTGKMKIYDTSSNGTYVNGEPVIKPEGKPVKRGDAVNFAHMVDLDWEKVRNPYKSIWMGSGAFLIIVTAIAVIFWIFGGELIDRFNGSLDQSSTMMKDSISPVNNTLKLETPTERPTPKVSGQPVKSEDRMNLKKKNEPGNEKASQNNKQELPDSKPDVGHEEVSPSTQQPNNNSNSNLNELINRDK